MPCSSPHSIVRDLVGFKCSVINLKTIQVLTENQITCLIMANLHVNDFLMLQETLIKAQLELHLKSYCKQWKNRGFWVCVKFPSFSLQFPLLIILVNWWPCPENITWENSEITSAATTPGLGSPSINCVTVTDKPVCLPLFPALCLQCPSLYLKSYWFLWTSYDYLLNHLMLC